MMTNTTGRPARTRRTQRTDAHRPGAIQPVDYTYLQSYALASQTEGWPCPPIGIEEALATCKDALMAGHAVFGGLGKCGICGAVYTYGDLWLHVPTGDVVHLGHDCADKYQMVASRIDYDRALGAAREKTVREHVREAKADKAGFWLADAEANFPGLSKALELDHHISRDLKARMIQHGSLSPAQCKLALKIVADAARQTEREAQRATEILVAAPQGKRISFQGEIVGAKVLESQYGSTLKITVKVTTAEGASWLAWGTCPTGIGGDQGIWSEVETAAWRAAGGDSQARTGDRLRGRKVDITATLKPGREPHFAVMNRPVGVLIARP